MATTVEEGLIAELRFRLEATSRGMIVCPSPAGAVFDMVAVSGKKCYRVQVKGAFPTKGHARRGAKSSLQYHLGLKGRYGPDNIDVLAVLCKDTGRWKFSTGADIAGKWDARIRHRTTKGSRNHRVPAIRWQGWSVFNH